MNKIQDKVRLVPYPRLVTSLGRVMHACAGATKAQSKGQEVHKANRGWNQTCASINSNQPRGVAGRLPRNKSGGSGTQLALVTG
jgi:hypothetical protein